jgi:alanyl-tRNA synthetase
VKSDEIRSRFLEFFRARGHVVERSDKIVPSNDPTLLFTSAGMVQFKPYYTGEAPVPYRRATTSQKCLRAGGKANDLDEVGKTSRHMTFFEMLGNFSFGDYFKQEAITWAWELVTQEFGIAPERVLVSVFEDDDEAHDIWAKEIGIPESRIVRMGTKDNFWGPAGDTGACGPCSELHWDRGEEIDPAATLLHDPKERFIEFYNLVFPQFDQQADGSRPPLKNRGIDTGMGLERLSALLQGVETVFDIDGMRPILDATGAMSRVAYKDNPVPYRVIADHARALSFMIADGVLPGNEGRGYVERRLLRRAARFGREIGLERPFLFELSRTVVDQMRSQYPELDEKRSQIEKVILTEEERFQSTLARGMDLIGEIFAKMSGTVVPGEELFKLHDTFGFPLDLATDIAEDRGFTVDREGFMAAMERQRQKARSAWTGSGEDAIAPVYRVVRDRVGDTEFLGYDTCVIEARVAAIVRGGSEIQALGAGEEGEVVLDRTPFYAESGGQVGDTGALEFSDGTAHVSATRRLVGKMTLHQASVSAGTLRVGDTVTARVDTQARQATQNHHTATHLLQAALQDVLGDHVHQAGSLVGPDRLRFDFTHFEAIDPDRLRDIERLVNRHIRTDSPVETAEMPVDEARKAGAMALFGEKYEDVVRVVKVDGISMELCGGTHVDRTGAIGCFTIVGESSIAAGVRRIEALCGEPGIEAIQRREQALAAAARALNTSPEELPARLDAMQEEIRRLGREVAKWKQAAATGGSVDYLSRAAEVAGVKLLASEVEGQDMAGLRMVMDKLRDQIGSGIVVLGSAADGKASLCVAVTKDLTGRISAGEIVKRIAPAVGGGGGGRPDMAQAGGKQPEKLPQAIAMAESVVRELLGVTA